MSKSKGNVINPIDLALKYGADAVRVALVMSSTPGSDSAVGENKIRGMRNFSNKIWNAARFVTMLEEVNGSNEKNEEFTKHLNGVIDTVTKQLDELKIGLAAETAYNEFWHWFCDEAIEDTKKGLVSLELLKSGLVTFLKLLHPFTPFVTEAINNELGNKEALVTSKWPEAI
jgi:valyl-tRNA synthetase